MKDDTEPIKTYTVHSACELYEDGEMFTEVNIVHEHPDPAQRCGIHDVHQSDVHGANEDLISNVTNSVGVQPPKLDAAMWKSVASMHNANHLANLKLSTSPHALTAILERQMLEVMISELGSVRFEVLIWRDDTWRGQVLFVTASRGHLPLKPDYFGKNGKNLPGDRLYVTFIAKDDWKACVAVIQKAAQAHDLDAKQLLKHCRAAYDATVK